MEKPAGFIPDIIWLPTKQQPSATALDASSAEAVLGGPLRGERNMGLEGFYHLRGAMEPLSMPQMLSEACLFPVRPVGGGVVAHSVSEEDTKVLVGTSYISLLYL